MNNNKCTYLKIKMNHSLECKKQKKIINIRECNGCKYREDKISNNYQIKKRTYKQAKKEKNRFSIIYQDLSKCCVEGCLTPYFNVSKNEVYEGSKRSASIKHGFVCSFCEEHHRLFHNDREFALYYKKMFQVEFEKTHSREEFLSIIHCNYLK